MRESQKSVTQELLISDMFFVQSFCEALGQASFGIIIADKKDVICFLNSKAGHFLGIQPSHFIGKRIHEILPDSADAPSLRNFSAYGVKQVFINERQLVCNTIPIKMGDTSMATVKILINFSDLTNLKNELKENTEKRKLLKSLDETLGTPLDLIKALQTKSKFIKKSVSCKFSFEDIIGESKIIRDLKKRAYRIAQGDSTILITGETGTGKELFAQAIHAASLRRNAPFVRVNCGSIPDTLLESELFGYEPGSFTGADKKGKKGKFEIAHNGTILLDESGDMPLSMQAKLLRVIQEGEFERIGGVAFYELDVRVIAATNKDLWQMVTDGEFREDLYYRLDVVNLHIPPLRDRVEDIPLLIDSFLPMINLRVKSRTRAVSDEVLACFQRYDWPGNVRELENVLERMVNLDSREVIGVGALPSKIREKIKPLCFSKEYCGAKENLFEEGREATEKEMIQNALTYTEGNKRQAALYLNMPRSTFYNKIKKYKISSEF